MENPVLDEILRAHDECLTQWEHAANTGDVAGIAGLTGEGFNGTSGYGGMDAPFAYDRTEGVKGLGQLMAHVKGAVHRADNRLVRMRSSEEAVIFYERIFEREGRVMLRFLVLQTWRLTDAGWRVAREAVEQLSA